MILASVPLLCSSVLVLRSNALPAQSPVIVTVIDARTSAPIPDVMVQLIRQNRGRHSKAFCAHRAARRRHGRVSGGGDRTVDCA